MKKGILSLAFLVLAITFTGVYAQDAASQEAMMKSMTPGEKHQFFEKLVGEWEYTQTFWMAPGAEPMKGNGSTYSEIILGGRYMRDKVSGSMMGMPFKGVGITGHNNMTGNYEMSWIDNFGTGIMLMKGFVDEDGNVLTLKGKYPDPATGIEQLHTQVITVVDANHNTMEYYISAEKGEKFRTMLVESTRVQNKE